MRVLAIDASLRNCGVAIVDGANGKSRALFFGTIHNGSSLRSSACLVAIRDRLVQLIREHQPDCCALEAVIYVQSHKTAILLGAARGAPFSQRRKMACPFSNMHPDESNKRRLGPVGRGKIRSRS
jgi:Holliday junction resolvasome, endonuclease subunit